jgi:hypothetical protein
MTLFGGSQPQDDVLAKQRRDLLRDAILDIQGSIRANDAKSSAALVVHGLLFAGVLTVTREVKNVYVASGGWQRGLMVGLLGLALIAFLLSVWELSRAVSPYHPGELRRRIANHHPGVFFPLMRSLREEAEREGSNELLVFGRLLQGVNEEAIQADYAAELLKLGEIRQHEADAARRGYMWLRAELGLVAGYLVFVATVAMTQIGG